MTVQFSSVIAAQKCGNDSFSVKAVDLQQLGRRASRSLLPDLRGRGRPFPPHPHARFAAVTHVLKTRTP